MKKTFPIIFICGLGGVGKSTLADKLASRLSCESAIVRLDWYLKYSTKERKERIDGVLKSGDRAKIEQEQNPFNWNDFEKFKNDLISLKENSKLNISSAWNQVTGEKDLNINLKFDSQKGVIICEGIYLLHPSIIDIADLVVCLENSSEEVDRRTNIRDSHSCRAQD